MYLSLGSAFNNFVIVFATKVIMIPPKKVWNSNLSYSYLRIR